MKGVVNGLLLLNWQLSEFHGIKKWTLFNTQKKYNTRRLTLLVWTVVSSMRVLREIETHLANERQVNNEDDYLPPPLIISHLFMGVGRRLRGVQTGKIVCAYCINIYLKSARSSEDAFTALPKAVDLEEADRETTNLLVFLLMQFLSRYRDWN